MYRLEETTRTKLIEEARKYDSLEDYIAGLGYQEWQDDYLESQGYIVDESSDVQSGEIDRLLKEIYESAQNKLQKARKEANMSQSELAKETGISVRTIQSYEQGARDISGASYDSLKKIAEALGVEIEELI